ncbi:MAG: helix-turn-helix domain-containing protein [Hyphomicrobiaceae bacterium]
MPNTTPALNPNPPKLVTGAQIKAARALLGWRRIDLAAAAGLHRNAVAYWEGQPRMPRSEPFACRKMRAALQSAGVVTVSTPAPGVCLLSAGPRRTAEPSASLVPMAPDPEEDGHRLITASNEPELCTMHNGLAVSAAQEQGNRSTAPDCEPATETSEAHA